MGLCKLVYARKVATSKRMECTVENVDQLLKAKEAFIQETIFQLFMSLNLLQKDSHFGQETMFVNAKIWKKRELFRLIFE
jgi:hypothetical protein